MGMGIGGRVREEEESSLSKAPGQSVNQSVSVFVFEEARWIDAHLLRMDVATR